MMARRWRKARKKRKGTLLHASLPAAQRGHVFGQGGVDANSLVAPWKREGATMQSMAGQVQPEVQVGCPAFGDEVEVAGFVETVDFVSEDGMAEMGEVNADRSIPMQH